MHILKNKLDFLIQVQILNVKEVVNLSTMCQICWWKGFAIFWVFFVRRLAFRVCNGFWHANTLKMRQAAGRNLFEDKKSDNQDSHEGRKDLFGPCIWFMYALGDLLCLKNEIPHLSTSMWRRKIHKNKKVIKRGFVTFFYFFFGGGFLKQTRICKLF